VGKNEAIYNHLNQYHPELLEDDFFKPTQQAIISVPQKAPEGAITRTESALDLLKRVAHVYKTWVKPGHRRGDNVNNVSTTITMKEDEWADVGEWMWNNREQYTALSVMPYDDHSYVQPPFEDINEEQYGIMMKSLHKLDLSSVYEPVDESSQKDNLACAAGACEIV
jgi:ribonucleoside-diphosphate reductase alpha chain